MIGGEKACSLVPLASSFLSASELLEHAAVRQRAL
jgi:hypothetical protein